MTEFSPGLILILGAALVPLLRGWIRAGYLLALPIVCFAYVLTLSHGEWGQVGLFDLTLTTLRVDRLSLLFAYIFIIAVLVSVIYSLHVKDTVQQVAGLVYAGSAVGAVFAGDLVTLFVFWEGTAIASVFLIWARRDERAYRAGMRYLIIQVGSGVLLLSGAILYLHETGSIAFSAMELGSPATVLILLAFGIKCAFPLLHNWLQDAYPEATVTGTVWLSAFTTKLAIYALARGFAGTEILIPIGAAMALFPIFYALIENDLRRVLAYSLNHQLGFMVVGIGIGTELALNGAAAHAAASVIYQGLLFMAMGAVLYRTGTARATDLGGLYKSMPWTAGFCLVGSATISGVPLFAGFASKALIISAAMHEGYFWTWAVLLLATVGAFYHSGIKVPYAAFFAPDNGVRSQEAPGNMLGAMALSAALCIGIGVYPVLFYRLLPFAMDYDAYTLEHVVTQLQLLLFAALAFAILMRAGLYPPELRSTNLDFDWFYRRAAKTAAVLAWALATAAWEHATGAIGRSFATAIDSIYRHHGPQGIMARSWPTGSMAFWATVLLALYLIVYYL